MKTSFASSSSSQQPRKFDVFLSFIGEDTRNNFVSHLYAALKLRGITTYFDEYNLQNGQQISPELEAAIQESKVAIIVLSKNYASSSWCLQEVVKIMECKKMYGLIVTPIFYNIDPSHVRKQTFSFAEAFERHEANFKDDRLGKVQIWREALKQVADLVGEHITPQSKESSCIEKIVLEVFKNLRPETAYFSKGIVGIESRVAEIKALPSTHSNEVLCVGLHGLGGVGKTTLARVVFDELKYTFAGSCFLQDVRQQEITKLQQTLLSRLLMLDYCTVNDVTDGVELISQRLRSLRVLVVLDDVDNVEQLENLAGECEWFGSGSKVIITTRDKGLLKEAYKIFEVQLLSDKNAMRLFCNHAFRSSDPPNNFVHLSERHLPLSLKVLGSYLYKRGQKEWENMLDKLRNTTTEKS